MVQLINLQKFTVQIGIQSGSKTVFEYKIKKVIKRKKKKEKKSSTTFDVFSFNGNSFNTMFTYHFIQVIINIISNVFIDIVFFIRKVRLLTLYSLQALINDRMHRQNEVPQKKMTNPSSAIPKMSALLVATRATENKITCN